MPVTAAMLADGHVIHAIISEPWTAAELANGFAQEKKLRDQGSGTIHTLLDLRGVKKSPRSVVGLARQSPSFTHPTKGMIAILGGTAFSRIVVELASRLTRYDRIHF